MLNKMGGQWKEGSPNQRTNDFGVTNSHLVQQRKVCVRTTMGD